MATSSSLDLLAVENLREYLRIPSVHPNVDYEPCVKFLQNQAKGLGLPIKIFEYFPKKPIVVLTWEGKDPDLPSIILNSHMDVVPVFEKEWKYKPFAAEMDADGNIYARGAQDMKSVGIEYLEAIRKLKKDKVVLKRTIHITFVPDEEIGGVEGMMEFVKRDDFKKLNVGFALDEGMPNTDDNTVFFYGERCIWQMKFHCTGEPGHGCILLPNTAGEKVRYLMDKLYDFRAKEKLEFDTKPAVQHGDITAINVTMLEGGVQTNVIPPELSIVVDCRIAPTVNLEQFEKTLHQWCKEAGDGVSIEFTQKQPLVPVTKLDDTNPYWMAFKDTANKLNIKLEPWICPGATDIRFLREIGIPALGFSPINNTPHLFHRENECLNAKEFLKGITTYYHLIPAIANV